MRTTQYRITPLRKSVPGNAHIRRFLLSWQKSGASTRARRNASRRGTGCSTGSGTAPSSRRCRTGWMIRSPKHSVSEIRTKSSRATHHAFFIPLKHHRGEACHPKQLLSGDACYQVIFTIRRLLQSGDSYYQETLIAKKREDAPLLGTSSLFCNTRCTASEVYESIGSSPFYWQKCYRLLASEG